jgi:hypothetical protein
MFTTTLVTVALRTALALSEPAVALQNYSQIRGAWSDIDSGSQMFIKLRSFVCQLASAFHNTVSVEADCN